MKVVPREESVEKTRIKTDGQDMLSIAHNLVLRDVETNPSVYETYLMVNALKHDIDKYLNLMHMVFADKELSGITHRSERLAIVRDMYKETESWYYTDIFSKLRPLIDDEFTPSALDFKEDEFTIAIKEGMNRIILHMPLIGYTDKIYYRAGRATPGRLTTGPFLFDTLGDDGPTANTLTRVEASDSDFIPDDTLITSNYPSFKYIISLLEGKNPVSDENQRALIDSMEETTTQVVIKRYLRFMDPPVHKTPQMCNPSETAFSAPIDLIYVMTPELFSSGTKITSFHYRDEQLLSQLKIKITGKLID
jgi:hypothetical protein